MILYVEYWRITGVDYKKILHIKKNEYTRYSTLENFEYVETDESDVSERLEENLDVSEHLEENELNVDDYVNIQNDDMARNLMILIGKAIDEWAYNYGMGNLPRHIVFKQALSIMNTWKDIFSL